ncbi:ribosomal protein L11 methyltransferase [Alphaproteobacteria bacterium]|nr:ribosomal protein L11 methyltransferase [Alphaproteobacteria bacterium]
MSKPCSTLWRVGVVVSLKRLDAFEAALAPFVSALSTFLDDPEADECEEDALWRLEGYANEALDRTELSAALVLTAGRLGIAVPDLVFERIADTDWVAANMRSFHPIVAGRFFIHGSHFKGETPPGCVPLTIDAGMAFGSGEHATTFGCLSALDALLKKRRFRRPLDLGCGSGVLALAAAKSGRGAKITAADIDPLSVLTARRNARLNKVASLVSTLTSDGYAARALRIRRPYDLILANILAGPLRSMAREMKHNLVFGGSAILSGLLIRQERMVLAAHRLQGIVLENRLRINGWTTLTLKRKNRRSGRTPVKMRGSSRWLDDALKNSRKAF